MAETVTIIQAARELQISPQTLRYMMVSGKIAVGDCGRRPGKKRGFYRVFRKMLDEEKKRRGIE
jgi:hypothetical protein